jgi:hypothetical protein
MTFPLGNIIFKLLLILLIPISSIGQKKGNTKVILDSVSLDKITLTLFENGYTIDFKDEKLKIVSTKTKDIGAIGIRLRVMQKDSLTILTGEVVDKAAMIVLGSSEPIYSPIKYGGMKGSTRRHSWNELVKMAGLIAPIVRYE